MVRLAKKGTRKGTRQDPELDAHPPFALISDLQRQRDLLVQYIPMTTMGSAHLRQVSRIPTRWLDRGNASDQRSRGLQRANNQCLMLSVLQCFMHQPQLL